MAEEEEGETKQLEERILVSVRLRPLNEKELARNDVCDWHCVGGDTIAINSGLNSDRSVLLNAYTFDRVFGFESSTKQVYEEGAKEVILSVVNGINSSVFAYGQTSSGKTYTMKGITECAVEDIYHYIETHTEREYVLKFSAMEIYNEAVRDLLSANSTPLRLLDDPEKGTVVEKIVEKVLRDRDHLQGLLSVCAAQRKIGETSQNETSSRSHQILRLTIESSAREYRGAGSSSTLTATVNFVDLAGSERASQILSTGTRLKEGSHINRSLLTLGTVIRKLSRGKNAHVPYRDSKLTRILQNSLGGNARTAIICTLSPARTHIEQSRNALFFASCAKEVATNAKVNLLVSDKALVKQLRRELAKMETEFKNWTSKPMTNDSGNLLKEKELLIEQMDGEIQILRKQRDIAESRVEIMLGSSRPDEHLASELKSRIKKNGVNPNKHEIFDRPLNWEKIAEETERNPGEDIWKEVRCMGIDKEEAEEETAPKPEENKECTVESSHNDLSESITEAPESTYEELQQRIQEMQSTINCLVNSYPAEESPHPLEARMSSSRGSMLLRSRSCRAVLTTNHSSIYSIEDSSPFSMDSPGSVQNFWWKNPRSHNHDNFENSSQKGSRFSTLSASFDDDDDRESVTSSKASPIRARRTRDGIPIRKLLSRDVDNGSGEFSGGEMGLRRKLLKAKRGGKTARYSRNDSRSSVLSAPLERDESREPDSDDNESVLNFDIGEKEVAETHHESQHLEYEAAREKRKASVDTPQTNSGWPLEFDTRRREIVELWDSCHVPLVHRTYFFLLFKGDPSDSVYLEVELRRLSFLKETFKLGGSGKKDSQIPTLASSLKSLNHEREMLSKEVHKKFGRKDREKLYQEWGIALRTKRRSMQLVRQLWSDMSDARHLRDSAFLVAKLVGIAEAAQVPKETFSLTFSPQPTHRKSFLWRHSSTTLS